MDEMTPTCSTCSRSMIVRWGKWHCRMCESRRVKERNRAIVEAEVAKRGSKCRKCGVPYEKGKFHWHHRVPSTKFKDISRMCSEREGIVRLRNELSKCMLVCVDCHPDENKRAGAHKRKKRK